MTNINNARLLAICSALFLCISCSNSSQNENAEVLEANITLLDWRQSWFNLNAQGDTLYSNVIINYKIENTGTREINSYEVYFRVETINNKVYENASSGEGLKIGEIDFNSARVSTDYNKAIKVEITGQFLE